MRALLLVAWHEFRTLARDRRFLFFSLAMPLLILAAGASPVLLELAKGTPTVAYLDEGGWLRPERLGTEEDTFDVRLVPVAGEAEGRAGVADGRYRSFWIVPAEYAESGDLLVVVRGDLAGSDEDAMTTLLRGSLLGEAGAEQVERLNEPARFSYRVLGESRTVRQGIELVIALAVPFLMAIAFPLVLSFSGGLLASAIASEKENRMIEVLVTSVRPLALVGGKILGLGSVALLQLFLWGAAISTVALLFLLRGDLPRGLPIPWDIVAWTVPFFLLGFLFCATLLVGVGVMVGETRSAQQVASLFMLLTFVPIWLIEPILDEPNGLIARIFTLFPFTAPVLVPFRLALGAIEPPELLLALVVMVAAIAVTMGLVARLFRAMMLRFGGTPSLRDLIRR